MILTAIIFNQCTNYSRIKANVCDIKTKMTDRDIDREDNKIIIIIIIFNKKQKKQQKQTTFDTLTSRTKEHICQKKFCNLYIYQCL